MYTYQLLSHRPPFGTLPPVPSQERFSPAVWGAMIENAVLLFHLETGELLKLDALGAEIWAQSLLGRTVEEIAACFLERYDAPPSQIEQDVSQLHAQLRASH